MRISILELLDIFESLTRFTNPHHESYNKTAVDDNPINDVYPSYRVSRRQTLLDSNNEMPLLNRMKKQFRSHRSWSSDVSEMDFNSIPVFEDKQAFVLSGGDMRDDK